MLVSGPGVGVGWGDLQAQSWGRGKLGGQSPFHLSWVPGSRESDKLIFAALEPRPRSRLKTRGFWGGSRFIAAPLHAPVLGQEMEDLGGGLYLPPRIPGYHAGGGGRTGYPPRSPPPSVLCPSHPAAPSTLEPPGCRAVHGVLRGPRGFGVFQGTASPPELGPSPPPAATCGSVAYPSPPRSTPTPLPLLPSRPLPRRLRRAGKPPPPGRGRESPRHLRGGLGGRGGLRGRGGLQAAASHWAI